MNKSLKKFTVFFEWLNCYTHPTESLRLVFSSLRYIRKTKKYRQIYVLSLLHGLRLEYIHDVEIIETNRIVSCKFQENELKTRIFYFILPEVH